MTELRFEPGDTEIVTPWFDTTGREPCGLILREEVLPSGREVLVTICGREDEHVHGGAVMASVEALERSILCEYPLWDSTGERVLMKCGWPKAAHGIGGGRIEDHEWEGMPIW